MTALQMFEHPSLLSSHSVLSNHPHLDATIIVQTHGPFEFIYNITPYYI